MSQPTTIVYADTCEVYRLGLESLLKEFSEIEVLATAPNEPGIKKAVTELQPAVLIFELDIPGMEGVEVCNWLTDNHPATRSLALTTHQNKAIIKEVLDAGIHGYQRKGCTPTQLVASIKMIGDGGTSYCPECSDLLMSLHRKVRCKLLNLMEIDVLRLLCRGMDTPEIAKALNRSTGAVNGYRSSISEKLGTSNHFLQAMYAVENGLVDPKDCVCGLGKG